MKPVKSKAISHVGYNADSHVLTVQYHPMGTIPTRTFRFADVPEHIVAGLHRSDSIGAYVQKYVIPRYKPISEKKKRG
jgi:hypothetical protein